MANSHKQKKVADTARPERRASKRLAEDLMRFEAAFEKLERNRMGLGAIGPADADNAEAPPIPPRDVQAYLNCLDEAIRQLAEEFSTDGTIANLIESRGNKEKEIGAPASAEAETNLSALRGPICQAFDARPCDAGPMPTVISQVDTSAV